MNPRVQRIPRRNRRDSLVIQFGSKLCSRSALRLRLAHRIDGGIDGLEMIAPVAAAVRAVGTGVHLGGGAHVQVESLEELTHARECGGHEGEVHNYLRCDDYICGVECWVCRGGVAVDEEEAEGGGDYDPVGG